MAKIKTILKRTLGGLKLAAAWWPFILASSGLALCVAGVVRGGINETKFEKAYAYSDVYVQQYQQESEALRSQLDNGEITNVQFADRMDEISSKNYMFELAQKDIPGNEEFQPLLQARSEGVTTAFVGVGVIAASLISILPWYEAGFVTAYDRVFASAMEDLKYNEESDGKGKKKNGLPPLKDSCEEEGEIIEDLEDAYNLN